MFLTNIFMILFAIVSNELYHIENFGVTVLPRDKINRLNICRGPGPGPDGVPTLILYKSMDERKVYDKTRISYFQYAVKSTEVLSKFMHHTKHMMKFFVLTISIKIFSFSNNSTQSSNWHEEMMFELMHHVKHTN